MLAQHGATGSDMSRETTTHISQPKRGFDAVLALQAVLFDTLLKQELGVLLNSEEEGLGGELLAREYETSMHALLYSRDSQSHIFSKGESTGTRAAGRKVQEGAHQDLCQVRHRRI